MERSHAITGEDLQSAALPLGYGAVLQSRRDFSIPHRASATSATGLCAMRVPFPAPRPSRRPVAPTRASGASLA